jgi:tetratricopeptide (TPR) repeat protein
VHNLAYIPSFRGDLDLGWSRLQEALAMARRMGDKGRMAQAASGLAYAAFMHEDYEAALPMNEEAIELSRETGNRFTLAESVETMGQIHRMLGNYAQSRAAYIEALRLKHEAGNLPGILTTLLMLSPLESDHGLHERAARLFGAASAMRETVGASPPSPALVLGDPLGAAGEAIGDEAVARALEDGRAMATNVEEAVAYASEDISESPGT